MTKKIKNMEEFASISGLSRPTVSKYFNDPDSVRPTTRQKIEAAQERYNYRPNIYAINQNRQLTKTVGIVVPNLADPYFAKISSDMDTMCLDSGFSPSLFSSHGKPELENNILDTLRSMKPAGVLFAPLGRASDKSAIERFCRDIPTVLFDSNIEHIDNVFIGSDNAQFTSLMVDYLCRTGDAPCFFEMETPANPNAYKRRNAYTATMEKLGHSPKIIQVGGQGWDLESIGYQGAMDVLGSDQLETSSILCSNDRLAFGFLAACHKKGVRVGHQANCDLRVAGLDNHSFSQFTCPSLTTISHDYSSVANKSVQKLFEMIETSSVIEERIVTLIPGNLIMRDSA